MRRRPPGAGIAPRHLAGWLFADLFLVLFVVVLGMVASDGAGETGAKKSPKPSASPSSSASPSPSRTAKGPTGLDPKRHTIAVSLSSGATGRAAGSGGLNAADRKKIIAALDKEMGKSGDGRRIGMVITFGVAPQAMLGAATDLAEDVNATLKSRRPQAFCGGNVGTRPFWSGGSADRVEIELYYINACEGGR
ncbi:hypothetical protein [Streptomyces justiciae]|uniref:Motility protein B-like N-terminal domain-containing protein n=1 Tax=Streptomyces justiciae TaxID=2780140 RepID=A0ABU3M120_9ACTN|nr:hypothetical protein [Streptomyces justiciae]MDT7845196.1 hypothetical protein [Streptomyces justiciae]